MRTNCLLRSAFRRPRLLLLGPSPPSSSRCSSSFVSRIDDERVLHSPAADVDIPKQHFFDFVWTESTKKFPDRIALHDFARKTNFTYRESEDLSARTAAALAELGVGKDNPLAIFLPNCPEYAFLLTGASLAGAATTTVNPAYTPGEVAKQLQLSGAGAVATLKDLVPKVREALQKIGQPKFPVLVVDLDSHDGDLLSFHRLAASAPRMGLPDSFDFEEDTVALPFSSGTTGPPKGVELTHKNLVGNARQLIYGKGFDFVPFPTDSFQPCTICVLPMFHIFGMNVVAFPGLHLGERVVTTPGFDPAQFVSAMELNPPDFMFFAPPLVGFCADHPSVTPTHLETLRFVFVGAAPVGQALIDKFKLKAPNCTFREGWGMTELSPVATMTPQSDEVKGSCGLVLPNAKLKIVDLEPGATNLGPGERGELCVKGPLVMKGYLNNPEATAATLKDGWLHSGDIAYYDDGGHVFIVDRLKELIKVKGFQVPPAELEDLLRAHRAVADVAVIGIPHDKFGEVPRAYVVKRDPAVDEEQLKAYVAAEVAEYKRLEGGVSFLEAIPKSPSGKILRKDLLAGFKEKGV